MKLTLPLLASVISSILLTTPVLAKTELNLQRFFGACEAEYGQSTNVQMANGECGIMTTLINKFNAENPDIDVKVTTVEWPGYDQLTAQMASRTPPDIVTMHNSVISDYQSRHLILPIDEILNQAKISTREFTPTALKGVTRGGKTFGLPIDTWTMLYHINMTLMQKANLIDANGNPLLPHSPKQLINYAKQFKQATGKPYFIQILSNETAAYSRLFYTYMFQQKSDFFDNPNAIKLRNNKARNIVNLFKQIYDEGLTTKNMDYPATVSAFANGEGGILLNGNWLISTYQDASEKADSALYHAYETRPYPQLYKGRDARYVDGHSWVMPNKKRSKDNVLATAKFFKFMLDNDIQWARTGHLPSVQAVLKDDAFLQLPHRESLLSVTETGTGLPSEVRRQFAIQDILGEELAAAITGNKPVENALTDAEDRINDMLSNL